MALSGSDRVHDQVAVSALILALENQIRRKTGKVQYQTMLNSMPRPSRPGYELGKLAL